MKLYMFIQMFVLLLLFSNVRNICCSTVPDTNSTDVLSLLEFKRAANDPHGALSNWNTSIHFCQWKGVTCNPKNRGRVTELNLAGQGLSGTIVDSVGYLTALHVLNLSSNQFSGQIPPLNNIRQLEVLDLNTNSLEGNIPDTLTNCSSLRILWLYSNTLTGTIPPNIDHLSNLVNFDLSGNNLTGIIPPAIGNIITLNLLNLGFNQLTGSIPDEIGKLSNMSVLELNNNFLSGGIPPILFNLSSLQILDLGSNALGKTLPSNMGDRLLSLQSLYLNGNEIEGQIPSSIGSASELQNIWISSNSFSGPIPTSLGNLSKLSYLNLEQNALETWNNQSWEFLNALRNCSLLNSISLDNNNLQGVLPDSIGNLSPSLQVLRMGFNNISGIIPPSIGELQKLTKLGLSHNSFTGTIEEWLGNLENLQDIHLEDNNFAGPIPSSVGNLKQLFSLHLAKNEFEGSIPANLGNLQQLEVLDLSYNKLQGSIPDQALTSVRMRICVLSYNNLEGPIPFDFSKLQALMELHLSSNAFTGYIPDNIGQCLMLETIEMDKNFLTGNISVSFSKLKSLSTLNLSHNNLSGTIPLILTDLQYLTHLDISYNHFNGEVHKNGVFANATAVSLEGNRGLCGGATDFHMPSCQVVSRRVGTLNNLFKTLIPIFGFMSFIMLAYVIFHWKKKTSRRPYLLLLSFGKKFPKVSYNDIVEATRNFCESNLIGRGSYGSVYKGKLTLAKMQVAIKVFDLGMTHADRSFISECEVLRRIRHRNLVPILTACSTIDNNGNDFKALIYVFMQNGNLDTWLHHRPSSVPSKLLGLIERINIAVSIADALAYLHHDCGRPIVHCDLKPTNILLDDDMIAHLGDFGIASLVLIDSGSTEGGHSGVNSSVIGHSGFNSSVAVTGTIGYIAPEYGQSVHASTCGDVFSFGIVLLEMVIGKRPTDPMFENELTIVSFVESNFPDKILGTIDAHLQEERKCFIQTMPEAEQEIYRCLLSVVQVALSCTRLSQRERMNMREVAINLHAIRKAYIAAIKQQ